MKLRAVIAGHGRDGHGRARGVRRRSGSMNTVNSRRYSEADTLREISPRTLVALMDDDREFLAGKGVELPDEGLPNGEYFAGLRDLFLRPEGLV